MATETSMSLDTIETGFTVFETDQVLTPGQLNGVADYLDDQERLTRVALLGVGIACGLWPSLRAGNVRLSHGVGTTTDGDLLFIPGATEYDRYKPYDSSAPKYSPFYPDGETMIAAYELVPTGESDARAQPLPGFAAAEGRPLETMAAVLYVESYLHDPDLCTATDCDNRGKDWIHATRLLLVDAKSAAALAAALDTPDGAARALDPVAIARPVLQGALAVEADLADVCRKAADAIHKALLPALGAIYKACSWFLLDIAPTDPAPRWQKSLNDIRAAAPVRGIQYYYDFLKDLAETYNAFRDVLFGDTAACCPGLDAFPKHLVLGALDPAQRSAAGRTGFYPSPMVSQRSEQRAHARFLIRKLDTLIGAFKIPGAGTIRATPSLFEDRSLERRAIPFYYSMGDALPVLRAWSYPLSQRGMETYNYSYNADRYPAAGAAAAPLQSQIGAFDFFRIEGHIGRSLDEVQKELDALIISANLPIDVVYLSLGTPGKSIPPWRNWHLYQLQHLVRSDLAAQLDDARRFGPVFVDQAKAAAAAGLVTDDDNGGVPVVGTAQTKVELMAGKAGNARAKILAEKYDPQSNWQDDVAGMTQTAAEMNASLSPVTKQEFVTPLDAVIAGQPARWLNWIDILIKGAEDEEAKRSQLPGFLADHPGLEHYAGALRGGTFVVVYDAANAVVADFMLPYRCCERRTAPPKPPQLVPLPRPDIIFTKPIRLVTLPDKFRFEKLSTQVVNKVTGDVANQVSYLNGLKDTIGILAGVKTGGGIALPAGGAVFQPGGQAGPSIPIEKLPADPSLKEKVVDLATKAQVLDGIRTQGLDPGLTGTARDALDTQRLATEQNLAATIVDTAEHLAVSGADVTPGTDGAKTLDAASAALANMSNIDALAQVEKGLMDVANNAATPKNVQLALNNMLSLRLH